MAHLDDTIPAMETFEPPKYIEKLIAAINDGAKSAQAASFLFLAVGLYLLATAFSASDEDLLLGRTVTISQIGASLPVSFSFAIAPLVFIFLHIYALVRYDMLAINVWQFLQELRDTVNVESDRERCRQLLTNTEFVGMLVAPYGSASYRWFWPGLFFGIVGVFPVTVLLLVQINALRYQSELILFVQRVWLVIDLVAIGSFFARNSLGDARLRRNLVICLTIVFLNFCWLGTVDSNADPLEVRDQKISWTKMVSNPLDRLLCPAVQWGCRFLRVNHRLLVDKARDDKALGVLREPIPKLAESPGTNAAQKVLTEHAKALAAIEGLFLRNRSLRFVALDESRLYVADLIGANLVGADLGHADLTRAHLTGANLTDASLTDAHLTGATLKAAFLIGATLTQADLSHANLSYANLKGSFLIGADVTSATLTGANLAGATLTQADLSHANLIGADLKGANLKGSLLIGADLIGADLTGANLKGSSLIGADLTSATLTGANVEQSQLDQACGVGAELPTSLFLKPCQLTDARWVQSMGSSRIKAGIGNGRPLPFD
jgi:uncharacterized protein YjbI with pentapeptide repeats